MTSSESKKEGGLEPPTRHPVDWKNPEFYDEKALMKELKRVYDVCHGCRRCFNLCNAFPRLFDAIDESDTMDIESLAESDYWEVVDDCYLCDRCYVTKCPYVPPHPLNIDFPHLMLRAKAIQKKKGRLPKKRQLLTETDKIGQIAGIPVVVQAVNAINQNKVMRKLMHHTVGIHQEAVLPKYAKNKTYQQLIFKPQKNLKPQPGQKTTGKVLIFNTCFGRHNDPSILEDLIEVFEHNQIQVRMIDALKCCGMPKLEIGDLKQVEKLKEHNLPLLIDFVKQGFDIISPVPSCTLMFRSELPLLFPEDQNIQKLHNAFFDPFEYLISRHQDQLFNTDFKKGLGKIGYHAPCHLSALCIGQKTKKILSLIPDSQVFFTDRCSGHNGTYGVRKETHKTAMKIGRSVFRHMEDNDCDIISSDCPIACTHIAHGIKEDKPNFHPITLLKKAYGL